MNPRIPLIFLVCALSLGAPGCLRAPLRLTTPAPAGPEISSLLERAEEALHKTGDPASAARLAREVLTRDPASARAHRLLLLLALLRDDQDAGFKHGLRALADGRNRMVGLDINLLGPMAVTQARLKELTAMLELLSREHPDPQGRADALGPLAHFWLLRGDLAAAKKALARRHLIREWVGISGFDNKDGKGFDTPYPPETEIQLDRTYPGLRIRSSWRPVQLTGPAASLELTEKFYPFSGTVSYLLSWVEAPAEGDAVLELTADNPVKVWVNDRLLLSLRQVRHGTSRQLRLPVKLGKGHNKILIKYCAVGGGGRLSAAIHKTSGEPMALAASPAPRPFTRDRRAPLKWSREFAVPPGLASLPEGPHRDYLGAMALTMAGLYNNAITALSSHLDRHPGDPAALMLGVNLHRSEGQLQQAARLVERGLKVPAPHVTRFWLERTRLFRQRMQEDKALEAVARARALAPYGWGVARETERLLMGKGWTLDLCKLAQTQHRLYPSWGWAAELMTNCKDRLGRSAEAERWQLRAMKLSGLKQSSRRAVVGRLMARGRCHAALLLQQGSVKVWPGRARVWLQLGDVHRRCGDPDGALKAYLKAGAAIPSWHLPHKKIGLLRYEAGDREGALKAWNEALRLNPEDTRLWDRVTHLRPDQDPVLERHKPSANDIAALVSAGRQVKPVEGASIVWLMDDDVTHMLEDGTVKRVITTVRMAVDRGGRDSLGEQRLPGAGLVKVLDAYTLDATGRRQEVTSMHGGKVRYPALQEGSVVVLQYQHTERPSGYLSHHLTNSWLFQHNLEQVVKARWVLALPKDRKLSVHLQGEVAHKQASEGARHVHTFSATNVPPLRLEPGSPPAGDLLAMAKVSTVPSWGYFSEWGRSLTAEVFEMSPDLKRALEKLVAGKKTRAQKLDAIYHFALTKVRYQQDYETFIAGVKPHPAASVLARGYGDCKDKSVLIIAMLRHLGFKAHLALIRVRRAGKVIANVPSQQFNHAVVYLPPQPGVEGKGVGSGEAGGRFLDATAENLGMDVLRQDVQGTLALVLFEDEYKLVPVPYQAAEKNMSELVLDLTLEKDGSAQVEMVWSMRGKMAGALRKPLQNQQILRQYAQGLVHNLYSGCTLVKPSVEGTTSITEPLHMKVSAACAKAARAEEKTLRLRLPRLFAKVSNLATWSERKHPLFFGPPELMEGKVTVKLPAGVKVKSLPEAMDQTSPCHTAAGKWITTAQGKVTYFQTFKRTCAELTTDKYPAFRKAISELARHLEAEAVLSLGRSR